MKKTFEPTELNIICFDSADVIVTSSQEDPQEAPHDESESYE